MGASRGHSRGRAGALGGAGGDQGIKKGEPVVQLAEQVVEAVQGDPSGQMGHQGVLEAGFDQAAASFGAYRGAGRLQDHLQHQPGHQGPVQFLLFRAEALVGRFPDPGSLAPIHNRRRTRARRTPFLSGLLHLISSLRNVTVSGSGENNRCKIPARKAKKLSS